MWTRTGTCAAEAARDTLGTSNRKGTGADDTGAARIVPRGRDDHSGDYYSFKTLKPDPVPPAYSAIANLAFANFANSTGVSDGLPLLGLHDDM